MDMWAHTEGQKIQAEAGAGNRPEADVEKQTETSMEKQTGIDAEKQIEAGAGKQIEPDTGKPLILSEGEQEAVKRKKAEIRRAVLARRNAMSEEERKRASLCMTDRILGHQWFYGAEKLLLFAGYGTEIDTWELISEALRMGKKVFLPRVAGEELEFSRIFSMQDLKPGFHGIPEPEGITDLYRYEEDSSGNTLMIMPGVAFDAYRNRIGYGKGFYDRYLKDKPALREHTIGIGFQCQLAEEIPVCGFDYRPYQVLLF